MGRVVVLDFDGTVCLGDEPVLEFARAVARRMPDSAAQEALDDLAHFLRDEPPAHLAAAPDGYHAVGELAERAGLGAAEREAAYRESRARVGGPEVPITAPDGIRQLIDRARSRARVVLVTNAPADGIELLLARLGLDGAFDLVVGDAGKPDGMPAILGQLLRQAGIADQPRLLLSVGDIWRNDLAPAAALGCVTAMIDRHGSGEGSPDVRAATIVELYPAIERWLDGRRIASV